MVEMIPPERMIADSVELITGTSSGTVADLQVQYDGNNYQAEEVTGVPGIDLRINFKNILRFSKITYTAYYKGSTSHYVEVQLFNYKTGVWEVYTTIPYALGMNTRYFDTADFDEHIKNGEVMIRFYHPISGTAAHDLFIDYVALIR